jgi:hypothetical protein
LIGVKIILPENIQPDKLQTKRYIRNSEPLDDERISSKIDEIKSRSLDA